LTIQTNSQPIALQHDGISADGVERFGGGGLRCAELLLSPMGGKSRQVGQGTYEGVNRVCRGAGHLLKKAPGLLCSSTRAIHRDMREARSAVAQLNSYPVCAICNQ